MTTDVFTRLAGIGLAAAILSLSAQGAFAEMLFKIVTVKDEIIVGLNDHRAGRSMGDAAGGIAKAIASKGSLTLWQYAVRQKDGERQMAPLQKVGVLANAFAACRALQAAPSRYCRTNKTALPIMCAVSNSAHDAQDRRRGRVAATSVAHPDLTPA